MTSETLEQAFNVVANFHERLHPRWHLATPLWNRDARDPNCYIVVGNKRDVFGRWFVVLVEETNRNGTRYTALEEHCTDQPPSSAQMHPAQKGQIVRTATGRPLKVITGSAWQ